MVLVVLVKDKKFLEVKLGELLNWILMWDFSFSGIFGVFWRGYYWYYNKYINVKKGSILGIIMVLVCYVFFNYSIFYKYFSECFCGILFLVFWERVVVIDFIRDSSLFFFEVERFLVNFLCFYLKELEGFIRV